MYNYCSIKPWCTLTSCLIFTRLDGIQFMMYKRNLKKKTFNWLKYIIWLGFFFSTLFFEELAHLITYRKLTSKQFESIPLGSRQEEWAGPAILKAKKASGTGATVFHPKLPTTVHCLPQRAVILPPVKGFVPSSSLPLSIPFSSLHQWINLSTTQQANKWE